MSKPTFVCVHGAWHSPKCFDQIRTILSARAYDCICPSLPSTGGKSYPPNYDFAEDVTAIRAPIIELVKDKDVIVILHSYSGIPGGQALEGLDKESCSAKGLSGGVTRIIYIVAFLVPEGFQHSPTGTRDNMIPVMKTNFDVGTIFSSFLLLQYI